MFYHVGDSQRTQNIQVNKVIAENVKHLFILWEKNYTDFLANPIVRRGGFNPNVLFCVAHHTPDGAVRCHEPGLPNSWILQAPGGLQEVDIQHGQQEKCRDTGNRYSFLTLMKH